MTKLEDGGPALPHDMTLRDYACIHLRIPETGKPWLDAIIQKARRDEFAGRAMQGMLAYSVLNPAHGNWQENCSAEEVARFAYVYADAMVAELRKEK